MRSDDMIHSTALLIMTRATKLLRGITTGISYMIYLT